MIVSERHAEWISLLEVSGPFLAVAVLEEAFPQGLDKVETPFRQRIRSAYDEWRDAIDEDDPQLDAIHREWVSLVVRDFLEYDSSVLRSGEDIPASLAHRDVASDTTFRPDFAVVSGEKARLLISVTAPGTRLDDPLPSHSWLASPAERLIQLCRTSGVPLGVVTNGERWMVVSAPADGGSSRASWYARLWLQEPVTLQAFYSLLGVRRCFGEEKHTLDALIRQSMEHQDEITDTLGEQVRRAVEVLVQALDRADQDRDRTLLQDVTPAQLFEAGLTVMMRLVVLLCAEERKLLLLGEPVYDQNYAITTLRAQLVEQASHGLEILERRQDAWSRLLATFRGIYGGIHHETLRLPPLGGSLFDPDRFPFLEGRSPDTSWRDIPAVPLPIDNRTVLLLLNALQVLEHKSGAQMLSYEALDVEQIGHVYEGLLERTVKRVPEVTLGLMANSTVRNKTGHPELPLSILEKTARSGRSELVEFLNEKTGRSKSALTKDLELPLRPFAANRLLLACGNDLALMERVRHFGQLLRTDSWEDPLVYPQDAFIVTHGVGRRETGSHYTPKSLTEPIVQHTLEPLVYVGPAEGLPRADWKLKAPHEILALKVCDLAMGSGAFLVQACRYLADRLVEALEMEERAGRAVSIEGVVLDKAGDAELLPRNKAERVLIARRLVASRCLYGVDINPLAVELAKLSLWLVTMMKGRPFGFLDHALKCGDSLIGIIQIKQLEHFSLRDPDLAQPLLETSDLRRHIARGAELRRELEVIPSYYTAQISFKSRLHAEAETQLAKLRASADFLIAAELDRTDTSGLDTHRALAASRIRTSSEKDVSEFQRLAEIRLNGHRPFHWPIEFPEVFEQGALNRSYGFDAFVGNPPFMGGRKISTRFGDAYLRYLLVTTGSITGIADLVCHFFRKAYALLAQNGTMGLIATNSISESDTRDGGLAYICENGGTIYRAFPTFQWPGIAAVEIAIVHIRKGSHREVQLSGDAVSIITPSLTSNQMAGGNPHELSERIYYGFSGSFLLGNGFKLNSEERDALLANEPTSRELVKPYVTGSGINDSETGGFDTFVIDPGQRTESEIANFPIVYEHLRQTVYPERQKIKDVAKKKYWWRFAGHGKELYERLSMLQCCLVTSRHAKSIIFSRVPVILNGSSVVFDNSVIAICTDDIAALAILQSNIHTSWAEYWGSKILQHPRYTPTAVLHTFPLPLVVEKLRELGALYHELRMQLMSDFNEGPTKVYNRFHNPDITEGISDLRDLHCQLDVAVAVAYGWDDLAANNGERLGHGFHETKQGIRYTLSETARREVLDRLLTLNHQRYADEGVAGHHDKKGAGKKTRKAHSATAGNIQELGLDFGAAKSLTLKSTKELGSTRVTSRSSADITPTELLNAIFTCTARRESTDREELTREIAAALGFQRLREKTRDLIASGFNSAIRRGLIGYEGAFIVRLATTYADLDLDTLVKAISAIVHQGRVYSPDEVFHNAADHLGCKRLGEPLRESLQSALTAASRRGIITKRDEEVRKAE